MFGLFNRSFCTYTDCMPRHATGKTPLRNVRIPDHVWDRAKEVAAERGETLTSVIESALRRYIARHGSGEGAPSEIHP